MGGYGMLARVLTSKRCLLGYQMLKVKSTSICYPFNVLFLYSQVLLDACLTQPILLQLRSLLNGNKPGNGSSSPNSAQNTMPGATYEDLFLALNHHALISNIHLITEVLLAWRAWEHADPEVTELLFQGHESLVCPDHPHRKFNIRQLQQAGGVRKLINICLERIQDSCPPLSLPVCHYLVNIVRELIGSPPDLHAVILLCDFLLLMHPAASTYVSHNSEDFYFSHKWCMYFQFLLFASC
jgi:hypothetical protein